MYKENIYQESMKLVSMHQLSGSIYQVVYFRKVYLYQEVLI